MDEKILRASSTRSLFSFCLGSFASSLISITIITTRLMDFKWSLSIKNVSSSLASSRVLPRHHLHDYLFPLPFRRLYPYRLSFIFQIISSNNLISDNAESDTSHENTRSSRKTEIFRYGVHSIHTVLFILFNARCESFKRAPRSTKNTRKRKFRANFIPNSSIVNQHNLRLFVNFEFFLRFAHFIYRNGLFDAMTNLRHASSTEKPTTTQTKYLELVGHRRRAFALNFTSTAKYNSASKSCCSSQINIGKNFSAAHRQLYINTFPSWTMRI